MTTQETITYRGRVYHRGEMADLLEILRRDGEDMSLCGQNRSQGFDPWSFMFDDRKGIHYGDDPWTALRRAVAEIERNAP